MAKRKSTKLAVRSLRSDTSCVHYSRNSMAKQMGHERRRKREKLAPIMVEDSSQLPAQELSLSLLKAGRNHRKHFNRRGQRGQITMDSTGVE